MPLPPQHSANRPSTTTAGTRLMPYRLAGSAAALSRMSTTSTPHDAQARRLMSATASSHAEQPALNTSIFRFVAIFLLCLLRSLLTSVACRPSAFTNQEQLYVNAAYALESNPRSRDVLNKGAGVFCACSTPAIRRRFLPSFGTRWRISDTLRHFSQTARPRFRC